MLWVFSGASVARFAELPLTRISLGNTSVTDLSPLDGNTTITAFSAGGTGLSDISALATMPLESVALQNNALTDISALANKPNLTNIILEVNDITVRTIGIDIASPDLAVAV